MAKGHDVIIYMRFISLEVVIPKAHVWSFMAEFGEAFAIKDHHQGTTNIRTVDHYFNHPNGWHIKVSVWENDEEKFYDFLQAFCDSRGFTFRKPEDDK